MKKYRFRSIRQRILALFLLAALVLTFLIIAATGFLTHLQIEDLVENNARSFVQAHVKTVSSWQRERIQELRQLANTPRLKTLDWDYVEPYLQRQIRDLDPSYLIFFLATPDGNYNTTLQRSAGNIADRSYFRPVLAGQTVISEPLISRSTGEKSVVIATPIWDEEELETIGILGLTVGLSKIHESLSATEIEHPDSYAFIIDQEGAFLTHPDPQAIMSGRIQDYYPHWDQREERAQGSFDFRLNQTKLRAFFAEIPASNGWTIVILVPLEYIREPVKHLLFYLLIIAAGGVILVFWIGAWFSGAIAEPIIELNEIFKQGSAGDLTVRAEVASTDEIGETRASFNRMMDTIGTMTYNDPLTRLPNRQSFLDHLRSVLGQNRIIILALISIRGFTEIKTLLGPDVTDQVSKLVAQTLKSFPAAETLVGRLSEEEYGLIIPSDPGGILRNIASLEELLKKPLGLKEGPLEIKLQGGLTISENGQIDPELFYQQVQSALYQAKRAGDDTLKLYDPEIHSALKDRLRFQAEIRTALDRKEFTLYYQPIVDLKALRVAGKEALIRWKHPAKGLLMPAEFIETAEESSFIGEIGEYVLRKTQEHHLLWNKKGQDLGWVAVNISPLHFRSPRFLTTIRSISALARSRLHIEITEETMLAPTETVLKNLKGLQEMDIPLAIDDFGTAYSSLEYLAKYPVGTLKIDRAFIGSLDRNPRIEGLVRSIIAMGQNLSLKVIAEGVERQKQFQLLTAMGCSQAQGFYFQGPIPWEEYPRAAAVLNRRLIKTRG
ncbi:MAG: EAL domain-containing protein [Firmicutes bacterium]|nr:EAL domain-containing protein [Bacillota bacterium]